MLPLLVPSGDDSPCLFTYCFIFLILPIIACDKAYLSFGFAPNLPQFGELPCLVVFFETGGLIYPEILIPFESLDLFEFAPIFITEEVLDALSSRSAPKIASLSFYCNFYFELKDLESYDCSMIVLLSSFLSLLVKFEE